MKRFVWLLIAVICTALAQVQAVDLPEKPVEKCGCCEDQANACGMPDCAPAPSAPSWATRLPAVASLRVETRKLAPACTEFFRTNIPVVRLPVTGVSPLGTPAARVPLFKAHCSFLI